MPPPPLAEARARGCQRRAKALADGSQLAGAQQREGLESLVRRAEAEPDGEAAQTSFFSGKTPRRHATV